VLAISWQNFRSRPGRFAGALVALTLGIALIAATGLVLSAQPPARTQSRFGPGTVVVTADQRLHGPSSTRSLPVPAALDPAVLARLSGLDGASVVADRVVDISIPLSIPDAVVVGHGWASAGFGPYRLASGTVPGEKEIVVDGRFPLAPGATLTVTTERGAQQYRVSGVTVPASTSEAPIFFHDRQAESLPGRLDAVVIRGAAVDAVAAKAPGLIVQSGQDAPQANPVGDTYEEAGTVLGLMAGISGFVCIFVVASTFGLSIAQRRSDLALLRLVGATPRQVRRMVLGEALLLGILAALAGNLLALPVGNAMAALLRWLNIGPEHLTLHLSWAPAIIASGIGLVVSLLGVWFAARRTRKVRAIEALRAAAIETRSMTTSRWIFGTLGLAGGTAMLWATGQADGDGRIALLLWVGVVLVTGVAAIAPILVPPLIGLAAQPLRRFIGVEVASASLRAQTRRTASVAAPILVLLGIAGSMLTATTSLTASSAQERAGLMSADLVLVPASTSGLTTPAIEIARGVPGVESVTPIGRTDVFVDFDADIPAEITPDQPEGTFASTVDTAAQHHWSIGDTVSLRLGDGTPFKARLNKTIPNSLSGYPISLPPSTVSGHVRAWSTSHAFVKGSSATALNQALDGQARAISARAWLSQQDRAEEEGIRVGLIAILGMAAVYTAIAIVNTLVMSVRERTGELAQLRLAGATRAQAMRVLLCEGALVLAVGIGLAAVITAVTAAALPAALASLTSSAQLAIPWPTLLALIGICGALVGATTWLASQATLRQRPLDGLGITE
jgi:putative ABC transport system permease protein